ncbi:Osmotic avoidance abnormal protein 3 [Folsomia candida]|uniref:Osmotic avoidance abnormal protein 3 n=1 Tax=Folsomia candida TaxID=158441 RepID=A0A226E0K4_FOLCA|nr:Osmotic avoidance abnormal protein 3 [Folsomia candida]
MSECVKVVVRCRPMNNREKDLHSKSVVYMDSSLCQCSIVNPGDASAPPKTFSFDGVYFTESTTEALYNDVAYPLVEGVLEGYNSTVFAYGQTGCGKSYTMQGVVKPPSQKGIIPRAFEHIFEAIETSDDSKFLVHASYLEIYNEEIRDLLGKDCKKKLDLKEHPDRGVYIQELSQHAVHNVEECEQMMDKGWRNRATGATLMNADSSRPGQRDKPKRVGNVTDIQMSKAKIIIICFPKLPGATGDRLKEATKINLSLSALGNVISALVDGKSKHIPYRDSKLTRLLQDSLGGNTKTLMVACVSPADNNYDETLSTLRYANRAKNIKNKPRINQDPKDALLSQYQDEIRQLKELLENGGGAGAGQLQANLIPLDSVEAEKEKIRQEYESQLHQLRLSYESEKQGKARLQADVQSLKDQYEKELKEKGSSGAGAGESKGKLAPHQIPIRRNSTIAPDVNLTPQQHEAFARLQEIETNMVGGEKADDLELLEKRQKKKKAAEKRSKVLAETLNRNDEDDALLIKAYDNIQEELRAKTDALKKSKQKIRALEREVSDLYSEFQSDRTDYLETIRRQDQQLKLLQAILDKIHPTVRRDCNYVNIDNIKSEAVW